MNKFPSQFDLHDILFNENAAKQFLVTKGIIVPKGNAKFAGKTRVLTLKPKNMCISATEKRGAHLLGPIHPSHDQNCPRTN